MIRMLAAAERVLWRVLQGLAILLLVALLGLLFLQIAGRYLRVQALVPHDEVVALCTVWFVFLSSALLARDHEHIRVEFAENALRRHPRARRVLAAAVELLVLVFVVFYLRSAWTVAAFAAMKTSQVLRWSEVIWYSSLVASAGLMALYGVRRIVAGFVPGGDSNRNG